MLDRRENISNGNTESRILHLLWEFFEHIVRLCEIQIEHISPIDWAYTIITLTELDYICKSGQAAKSW